MRALMQALLMIRAAAAFFGLAYLTYLCMYLAPTDHRRRWGSTTSWFHMGLGPSRLGREKEWGAGWGTADASPDPSPPDR